ncbi:MAG: DUF86 domain-containing protein [Deltaproteobacteria bacterium]|nr:DUF86 domain-containing protein [Deltaproteobacteria bacterium]
MNIDKERLLTHLYDVKRNALDLEKTFSARDDAAILADDVLLKAIKYVLIETAEAVANALQHVLAKGLGTPVSGYLDTLAHARSAGVISEELFLSLKPFFEFRNALIHRYWTMDDALIVRNARQGHGDFMAFIEAVEKFTGIGGT